MKDENLSVRYLFCPLFSPTAQKHRFEEITGSGETIKKTAVKPCLQGGIRRKSLRRSATNADPEVQCFCSSCHWKSDVLIKHHKQVWSGNLQEYLLIHKA